MTRALGTGHFKPWVWRLLVHTNGTSLDLEFCRSRATSCRTLDKRLTFESTIGLECHPWGGTLPFHWGSPELRSGHLLDPSVLKLRTIFLNKISIPDDIYVLKYNFQHK
ncbi:hypothetical protein J6590_066410 [Homalodisca vitripennis]|nr:hypothetical protein J6590_066410 [Homalodisca vitripennis]